MTSLFSLKRRAPAVWSFGVVLALILVSPVQADDAAFAPLRARMQKFVDNQDLAGVVTVVGRCDTILSHDAVGLRTLEGKEPMARDAIFRIASMTKPITALGIMILQDEGKLSVEDAVEKHLPEFRGQMMISNRAGDTVTLIKPKRPITLRDLLTHTSGLPGSFPVGLSDLYAKRHRSLAEAIPVQSQRPLDFEPGTRWAYCNAGIDTLGRIIEVVSGHSFENFLQKRVFDPLGMKDTTFYPTPEQLGRSAATYDKKEGKLTLVRDPLIGPPAGARFPIPAGGLYSTGGDLAKLYQMMLGSGRRGEVRIISEVSVKAMTQLQTGDIKTGFVDGMGFGFGFAVVREPKGVTAMLSAGSYGHGGAFGTQGWIDPHKDLFTILLIQRVGLQNGDASPMRQALQEAAVAAVGKP